jgi:hypothetical protein
MTMRRIACLLGVGACLAAPGAASAQDLPPSLTTDTAFALEGTNNFNFRPALAIDDAHGAANDPVLDRTYSVGRTETLAGDFDVAIVARRADGSPDPAFAGDGSLSFPITPGNDDAGVAIAVMPDHSLLVLASSDTSATATPNVDVALVAVLPDGTVGTRRTFDAGSGKDEPTAFAVNAQTGDVAITGSITPGLTENTFLAVRHADGSASGAVQVLDRGLGVDDRGTGVVWRGASPVAAIFVDDAAGDRAFVHDFGTGVESEVLFADASGVVPQGVVAFGDFVWATGSVVTAGDSDAWLARFDGASLQTRRFDIRGVVFPLTQPVDTAGLSITVVPGVPDTVVVGGSTATDTGPEWSFAAFNELDRPLDALQMAELVIRIDGEGAAEGVAGAAGGTVAVAGTLTDYRPDFGGSSDQSIGMARVLVDAEKRCDLALSVVSPVELVLRGTRPSQLTVRVTNNGTRRCAGQVSLPAPYGMSPWLGDTGMVSPGASITRTVDISYGAALKPDDLLQLTLTSPDDAQVGDNVARVRVTFTYCDLQLAISEQPSVLGTEGARRFAFTLRNLGTAACPGAQIATSLPGVRSGVPAASTLGAGRAMTAEFDVGVVRGTKSGTRPLLAFTAQSADDVSTANNGAASTPLIVRPGDTNISRPGRGGRVFRGKAKPGAAKGVRKKTLAVKRVEIAVLRTGKGCKWLSSTAGELRTVDAGVGGKCDEMVWVRARGTKSWRVSLRKKLPTGRYTIFSRAVLANGLPEGKFSSGDRNRVRFRVR